MLSPSTAIIFLCKSTLTMLLDKEFQDLSNINNEGLVIYFSYYGGQFGGERASVVISLGLLSLNLLVAEVMGFGGFDSLVRTSNCSAFDV